LVVALALAGVGVISAQQGQTKRAERYLGVVYTSWGFQPAAVTVPKGVLRVSVYDQTARSNFELTLDRQRPGQAVGQVDRVGGGKPNGKGRAWRAEHELAPGTYYLQVVGGLGHRLTIVAEP
jgi:hypothetical protein